MNTYSVLVLVCVLGLLPVTRAAEPVDVYGDPLPEGAIARLGTVRFRHGGQQVKCVAYSPDGKTLASGGRNAFLHLWDLTTGKMIRSWQPHDGDVGFIKFLADGKTLITAGPGPTNPLSIQVRVCDVVAGKLLTEVAGGAGLDSGPSVIAVAPDGKSVVANGGDNVIHRFSLPKGEKVGEYACEGVKDQAYFVAFSPDGRRLASGGSKLIRIWDAVNGKVVHTVETVGRTAALAFAPDGKTLAAADHTTLRLFDPGSGKEVRRIDAKTSHVFCVAFSPDGKTLAWGVHGTLRLYDVAGDKESRRIEFGCSTAAWDVAFAPDSRSVAVATEGGVVRIWDLATGKEQGLVEAHSNLVRSLAFSKDGKDLVSSGDDSTVRIWDVGTAKQRKRFGPSEQGGGPVQTLPGGRIGLVDDERLLVLDADGRVAWKLDGFPPASTLCLSADGKLAATLNLKDGSLRVWDVGGNKELRQLHYPQKEHPNELAFSPDGRLLAVGGGLASTIWIVESSTGKERQRVKFLPDRRADDPSYIHALTFTPDGTSLAVAGEGLLATYDVETGACLGVMEGKVDRLGCFAFSPDGRTLAANKNDDWETIHLWEVASGKERRRYRGHTSLIYSMAFSPDGRLLASGGADTTILLWPTRSRVEKRAGGLTAKERDELWDALASADAAKAERVVAELAALPKEAVALLRERLRPADAGQIERWLADLDGDDFAVRRRADAELEKQGPWAEAALRKALAGSPSPEARRRLEGLLDKLTLPTSSPEVLRVLRALEAVELIGTVEAREFLQALQRQATPGRLDKEINAALNRLSR